MLMMRLFTRGLGLTLLSSAALALAGCAEDNEAFIKEQKAKVKTTVPRARAAQAQSQEEFYEITPGVRGGVGTRVGPVPDTGPRGYPAAPKQ
jgi:ABC-type oligopeptide transport system substrate-binding subunit